LPPPKTAVEATSRIKPERQSTDKLTKNKPCQVGMNSTDAREAGPVTAAESRDRKRIGNSIREPIRPAAPQLEQLVGGEVEAGLRQLGGDDANRSARPRGSDDARHTIEQIRCSGPRTCPGNSRTLVFRVPVRIQGRVSDHCIRGLFPTGCRRHRAADGKDAPRGGPSSSGCQTRMNGFSKDGVDGVKFHNIQAWPSPRATESIVSAA